MPTAFQTDEGALFRTLIATAVDGIIVIDPAGHVQVYNAACERLFGYSADEVIGRNVKMLMPSPYREQHNGYLSHYRQTGEKRIIGIGREAVGQRKDGSTFPIHLSVGEGRVAEETIFVGIIHDLSERKGNERRVQELQSRLFHLSRLSEMSQMASALAHELNQPLTAIMNYAKAARRTLETLGDPQVTRAAELIDKAAGQTLRAGQIIRRLRDFIEKKETGRSEENLNNVIKEAVELGLVGAAEASVRVRIALDPKLPPILVDKIQIQQVMVNLIRNSIEAMQSVTRRELAIITAAEGREFAKVTVSDTGPGLPEEVARRLFQPFVTTKEKGMGIGLTICQSIVEAHGGRIWAAPNEGGGVAFHFRLPLAAMEPGHDA